MTFVECSFQNPKPISKFLSMLLGATFLSFLHHNQLYAQIVPDQTLPTNSQATVSGNNITINGGTLSDNNLFHSFKSFSVSNPNEVVFNNALSVENIIGRVTGQSISNIDTIIRANGNANLILLNPNGIIFGPNARLNVGGSFLASTANSVTFSDGRGFSATNSQSSPLLTVTRPVGLRFIENGTGRITNQGNLAVTPSHTLALIGGDIHFSGGQVVAESGRVEIGSVSSGTVNLNPSPLGWRLGYNQVNAFKNIQFLSKSAILNPNLASNLQAGIQVQGNQITLNQSQILARTLGNQPGADIKVSATASLDIGGEVESFFPFSSWIANVVGEGASGKGGQIVVAVPHLSIRDGGRIQTLSLGNGAAGNIKVNAETILLSGGASPEINTSREFGDNLNSRVSSENFGNGVGGNINVTTGNLTLLNGGRITTVVGPSASREGGDITVNASKSIFAKEVNPFEIDSPSNISAITFGLGDGGQLNVSTQRLQLQDGAQISTRGIKILFGNQGFTPGSGNVGNVLVKSDQSLTVGGASKLAPEFISFLGSITNGTGKGGNVTVVTKQLTIQDGGSLSSSVFSSALNSGLPPPDIGLGEGGNLTVNVSDTISIIGINPNRFNPSPSILGTFTLGDGDAGDTVINTRKLTVLDGGQVNSGTLAGGDAGRLFLNADESVFVGGTAFNGLPAQVASNTLLLNEATRKAFFLPPVPKGDTSELTINTGQLTIANGGRIGVQHDGTGNAGELKVNANKILIENQGAIIAETASGEGGNITLKVQDILLLRRNSKISAEARGTGNGGNINIDTQFLIASPFENSDIIANAFEGKGGNIRVKAQGIFGTVPRKAITPLSDITASSQQGIDGVVEINNPEVDPSESLAELPETVETPQEVVRGCRPGQALGGSKFVHVGRGGLPSSPNEVQTSYAVWQDLRADNLQAQTSIPSKTDPSPASLTPTSSVFVEAKGWSNDSQGRVRLTAHPTKVSPGSQRLTSTC